MFGLDGVAAPGVPGVIDGCDPALAASLVDGALFDGALVDGALFDALRDTLFASAFADAGPSGAAGNGAGSGEADDPPRAGIGATIDPARGARASGATAGRSPEPRADRPLDDDADADRADDAAAAAEAERDIEDAGSLPRADRRRGPGISSSGWIACRDGSVRSRGGSAGSIVEACVESGSSRVGSS